MIKPLLMVLLLTTVAEADELTTADLLSFGFPVWDEQEATTELLTREELLECVVLSGQVVEEAQSVGQAILRIDAIESGIALDELRIRQGDSSTATRRPGEAENDDIAFPTLAEEKERLSREMSEYLDSRASHFTHLAQFVSSCGHKSYLVEDVRFLSAQ